MSLTVCVEDSNLLTQKTGLSLSCLLPNLFFAEAERPLSTNLTFSTEQNDIPVAVSSSISTELQPNTNSLQIGTTTGSEKGMDKKKILCTFSEPSFA